MVIFGAFRVGVDPLRDIGWGEIRPL